MYDDYYEEYMNNVLGYGYMPEYRSPYCMMPQDLYGMNTYMENEVTESQMMREDLEECYPEIYKVVYPMVKKTCKNNTRPLTKRLIDDLVNDIYVNIEPNDSININVNVGNTSNVNSVSSERDIKSTQPRTELKPEAREVRSSDTRHKETRQINFLLNDLIRILVLRELLDKPVRPGRPDNRPPHRPPMNAPYPGPGFRPPIMPRNY